MYQKIISKLIHTLKKKPHTHTWHQLETGMQSNRETKLCKVVNLAKNLDTAKLVGHSHLRVCRFDSYSYTKL